MDEHKSTVVWALIGVVVLFIVLGGFGMGGYGMMGAGMGFGFLFMLLFWGAVIWLVITLISKTQSSREDSLDALTILKRRYARGEITKKEFEEIRKEL